MAEAPPPGRGFRVTGMIMTIVGAVIMIGSITIGAMMADTGIGGTVEAARNAKVVVGAGQVEFEAGADFALYQDTNDATPTCQVLDPSGAVVGSAAGWPDTITTGGRTWISFDAFRADVDGLYSIDCGGAEVLVSAPLSIGGIFTGVGGILLAVFGGLGGGVLLVVGLILYFVGRSKAKRPQQPPYPHGPHGGQYAPGQQQYSPYAQYPQYPQYAQDPQQAQYPEYPQHPQYPQYPQQPQHHPQQPPPGQQYPPPGPSA